MDNEHKTKSETKNPGFELGSDVVSGVTVSFFDFNDPKWGVDPGIYYAIPLDQSTGVRAEERLRGPFETRAEAVLAAKDFINDADTEQALDVSDEEIEESELSEDEKRGLGAEQFGEDQNAVLIFPVDARELA